MDTARAPTSSHLAGTALAASARTESDGWWSRITSAKGELYAAISAGALLLIGLLARHAGLGPEGISLSGACNWLSLAIGLFHGARAAWESLRLLRFDIDVLMVVGAVLAAVMGAPAEGALLLFLFVLSGALEALAMQRTTRAVEALHKLMPTRALRLKAGADANGQEVWEEVAPETLAPGDIVKSLPGETIPADAVVVPEPGTGGSSVGASGEGWSVNQASLTGESMPRTVVAGDEVFAGTINIGNPLRARVLRPAAQSSLQRILNLVIEAQQQREPVQRFIDRLSQPYAIGVLLVSIAVFFVWWRVFGAPVWSAGQPTTSALYVAITLLIVASPCAIIIATPTATLAAIARGARQGVLFKGGQAIERLSRLRAVCFDKTGTLTVGKPRVQRVQVFGDGADERELVAIAAGLETESTHPIAAAILAAASERSIPPRIGSRHQFTVGRGVSGVFDDKPARLGSFVFVQELLPEDLRARVQEALQAVQRRGEIGVLVAHGRCAAVFVLADSVRPGAPTLVRRLHELGVRPVVMLTGDNHHTAESVARELDIDLFFAQLLPGDKVEHVRRIKAGAGAAPRFTGVIGDGVNDAPALSAADVSIAIGSIGSDAALESADIVLLADDLAAVPWAVGLARRARRTIALNFTLALTALAVMAVWTLVGSRIGWPVPLWVGVLGHEGGTLIVVLNSLLLLAHAGMRGDPAPQETAPARP
jgi:Cd2+/Zn2+-exporting ATPase